MRRKAGSWLLLALLVTFMVLSTYAIASTDGWYHDLYCWGKIDNLDPWCP